MANCFAILELVLVLAISCEIAWSGIINPAPQPDIDPTSDKIDIIFTARSAVGNPWQRWPHGKVPYKIDWSLAGTEKEKSIKEAIADFNANTCIQWVPQTTEYDYVNFFSGEGCYSYIGKKGGKQKLSLGAGCGHKGLAIHEMLHALGFFHEHNRSDRDTFVTINEENIIERPDIRNQFSKVSPASETTGGTAYDFESIMHYPDIAFSKNGQKTIVAKPDYSQFQSQMGQRQGFSERDVEEVNKLYGCDSPGPSTAPTASPKPETTTQICVDLDPLYCGQFAPVHCQAFPFLMDYCQCSCPQ